MESSGTNQPTTNTTDAAAANPVSPFAPADPMTPSATMADAVAKTPDLSNVTIPEPKVEAESASAEPKKAEAAPADGAKTETGNSTATGDAAALAASAAAPAANAPVESTGAPVTGVPVVTEVAETAEAAPLSTDVTIEALLEECVNRNASDLHIQVGLPPILRLDGVLRPITTYPILDASTVQQLIFATLDEDQQKILMKDKEFDYSFAFGDLGRFRVNAFHERGNMAAAFRLIPNEIKSLDDLGLPAIVETFADHPHGLVLVTGPTGSGKSTTLAALIDKINSEKAVHIITIEDPVEFTHHSKRAVVAQREVHYDTFSFAAALRSILREDPDVVLIGEMRDLETIQAAITTAETGHLVFATLHTNSAAQSIDRIIDVFPAHQQSQIRAQLANVLNGIVSQRLIPAIDGGRVCVTEILVANPAVRAIIREGKTHQLDMTMQTSVDQGMQTMDRELAKLVKSGTISYDVASEYAVNAQEFERLARG